MIAREPHRHVGNSIGNGHCVAFVRDVTGLPPTATWRKGPSAITAPPGSAIATFDAGGTYGNHTDGRSHCAILLDVTDTGLRVLDQWLNQPVHERLIRFKGGRGPAVDDGDRYHVIEVA